jgi:murein DD-endopeptidase MepM/ murein hydrolase activator NlpD
MGASLFGRGGAAQAAAAVAFAGIVAACAAGTPAPIVLNGGEPGIAGGAPIVALPPARPHPAAAGRPGEDLRIVVRPGQSVGRLAEQYHVPAREIIAANHLAPPFKIETGQRLLIPGAAERAMAAKAAPAIERHTAERAAPEIISLDGPVPPRSTVKPPHAALPLPPPAAGPAEPSVAAEAARETSADHAPRASAGSSLPWPVQGRILAGYGAAAGGRRNDGIDIAAPRGAPVHAVDGGVVAYAGNELRGYGNLVLIKHRDGFISAYAHCEELLVHRGEQVARGQVIAKVGATGGVGAPQLHFELRRGEHAVDPRGFLAPLPSAVTTETARPG